MKYYVCFNLWELVFIKPVTKMLKKIQNELLVDVIVSKILACINLYKIIEE